MGLHVAQMTGQAAMRACYAAVTETPATLLGLDGYGLAPGCRADFVWLQAHDPVEAIRLRATRLGVWKGGRRIVRAAPQQSELILDGRTARVDFLQAQPGESR